MKRMIESTLYTLMSLREGPTRSLRCWDIYSQPQVANTRRRADDYKVFRPFLFCQLEKHDAEEAV